MPKTMLTASKRFVAERNKRILAMGSKWDLFNTALADQLIGLAGRGGNPSHAIETALVEARHIMERLLHDVLGWAWDESTMNIVEAIPLAMWLRRLSPIGVVEYIAPKLLARSVYNDILHGRIGKERAKELIRKIEFPSLPTNRVHEILNATIAKDGLSAMARIVTVAQSDKRDLLDIISHRVSDDEKASYVEEITPRIRELVGNVTYKAKRIARTEGLRIAEAMQRESWEPIQDLMQGVRTFTADDSRVRDSHQHWHNKLFLRTSTGEYVAEDGERLPDFPADPNCRCWSTPEFSDEITKGLPPAVYANAT